jgi:hypothetical protein
MHPAGAMLDEYQDIQSSQQHVELAENSTRMPADMNRFPTWSGCRWWKDPKP